MLSFFNCKCFHWFSSKFLNIYLADPNFGTYTFYVTNCRRYYKLYNMDCWNSIQLAPILCCFAFSFGFIFIQMDEIASYVLTALIGKNIVFPIFIILLILLLYYVFQAPPICLGFLSISQNLYNPRLNKKQAIWISYK